MNDPVPDPAEGLLSSLADDALLAGLDLNDRRKLARHLEVVEIPAGERVLEELAAGQEMFFVVEGEVRLRRANVDLGTVGPGGHFGEMALVTGRPRTASVASVSRLVLAKLTRAGYEALAREDPALALRFTQAVVGSVGTRLLEMTDSVGLLLRERSLPRRVTVEVAVGGVRRKVRTGTPLRAILPAEVNGAPVVAALLGNKAVGLDTPVTSEVSVEPLSADHWEGKRVYRLSLGLLLLEAAARVDPEGEARLGPSLGFAQRVVRAGPPFAGSPEAWAERVTRMMRLLVAIDARFRHELWSVDEARSHFEERGARDVVLLLRSQRDTAVRLVSCGDVYALGLGPLLPSTSLVGSFSFKFVPAEPGFLLHYGDEPEDAPSEIAKPSELAPPVSTPEPGGRSPSLPPPLLPRRAEGVDELWLGTMGVESVGAFNEACIVGNVSQIIRVCEGLHEKRIGQIADIVADRAGEVRIICIAGPSSSGKTTFIKRLTVQLQVVGVHPVAISLDDYYLDRERTPLDEHGQRDYEAVEALDLPLLHDHLRRLLAGEEVKTARFDFPRGTSLPSGGPTIALRPTDVLLLEGIHGLNPLLFGEAAGREVFRVFIQPTSTLPFDALTRVNASDLRLLRRIVRDRHQRGTVAAENIQRWPAVRAGERKHIFPFLDRAHVVFDSSLVYEPSVIKVFADRYLLEVPEDHPSFVTAHRLRRLIDNFVTIYPDHVPPTSILREFIGGSGFEY